MNEMHVKSESTCDVSLLDSDFLGLQAPSKESHVMVKETEPILTEAKSGSDITEKENVNLVKQVVNETKTEVEPQILPLGDIKVTLDTVKPSKCKQNTR